MRDEVLLSHSFHYADASHLRGRARLYADRIELTSWTWRGRSMRTIRLSEIAELQWWSGADDVNLAVTLVDGEAVRLKVEGVGLWKYKIEEIRGRSLDAPKPSAVMPVAPAA